MHLPAVNHRRELVVLLAGVVLSCQERGGTHPTSCLYQIEYKRTHFDFYEAQIKIDSTLSADPSVNIELSLFNNQGKDFQLPLLDKFIPSKDSLVKFYLVDKRNDSLELVSQVAAKKKEGQYNSTYHVSLFLDSDELIDKHREGFSQYDYPTYLKIYSFIYEKVIHGKLVVVDKHNHCVQEVRLNRRDKISFL